MDRAILLMGATATGKTDLAVQLAERFPIEIISVDSALIYRNMNIGTAKPDPETLQKAPHFLIDIVEPSESWSVWDFVKQASLLIKDVNQRNHIPLLVGGTMMYFNALEQGMNDLPVADEKTRQSLAERIQQEGLELLYQELEKIDPETAQRLQSTDSQRIQRALEVYYLSGKPMSELLKNVKNKPDINFDHLILDVPDRTELHQRIEQRFQHMMELGFEKEVMNLRERDDVRADLPSMRCVGYRQMWEYLEGNYSYQEMVNKSVVATRQLAKRQMTWLRKYEQVKRLDYLKYSKDEAFKFVEKTISNKPGFEI